MGADAQAVVAPDLTVREREGLWVADISILPRHIAGNTNATALMIGEKAAELISNSLKAGRRAEPQARAQREEALLPA
jgi:choline dehydrogenase